MSVIDNDNISNITPLTMDCESGITASSQQELPASYMSFLASVSASTLASSLRYSSFKRSYSLLTDSA